MGQLLRRYDGSTERALAAYNWGMGNLERQGLNNAPAETRNSVRNIMNSYNGVLYRQAPRNAAPGCQPW
jgi:soluble lytic murein transglycosylase-like protein